MFIRVKMTHSPRSVTSPFFCAQTIHRLCTFSTDGKDLEGASRATTTPFSYTTWRLTGDRLLRLCGLCSREELGASRS